MKHVSTLVFLLIFAVSTVQAQECPNFGTLPAPIQSFFSSNKHYSTVGDNVAITTSELSIEQQVACMAGKSLITTGHVNAEGPYYSSLEELWLGNAWHPNSKLENEYNEEGQLISKIFLRWNSGSQAFIEENATFYSNDANGNTSEVITKAWNGTGFENQYKSVFEKDTFGNLTLIERFDWENGVWKTRFLSTSMVVDGRITETTIQTTHAQGVLANAQLLTFEYDGEGREIVELQERWDENTQSWEPNSRDLTTYSGSNVVTMSQVFEGGWIDFMETTEMYDDKGLVIEQTSVSPKETVNGLRFLFEYDDAGNLTEIVAQDEDEIGGWRNQSRQAFTHDLDADPLVTLIQMYDNNSMMWVSLSRITFNYQQNEKAISIEEDMILGVTSFDVYPYPAKDRVNVELQLTQASELGVEVFDVLGRRVINLTEGMVSAGTQRFSWLPQKEPAGLYFIRLSVDGAVDMRPIVLVK